MIEFPRAPRAALLTLAFGLALIAGLALAAPGMAAATPVNTWVQQTPATSPSARVGAEMAYDPATGQLVLFGGHGGGHILGDTWTWDGTDWTEQTAAAPGPPAREAASMAYDGATGELVLFGGFGGESSRDLDDTWTWNGTRWTEASPLTRPPARAGASMAYDSATGQMILFGGLQENVGFSYYDETWAYDGSTWTQQSPPTSPSARIGAGMAFDSATDQMILFGGNLESSGPADETWTYDGSTWTRQSPPTSPSPRSVPMAYDSATDQMVLFGGTADSVTFSNDTWTYDGSAWTQQLPGASPPARASEAFAYDAGTDQVVLFGGSTGEEESDLLGDTWTYRPPPAPRAAPVVTPTPAPTPAPTSTPTGPVANGPAASTSPPPSPPPSPKVTLSREPRHLGRSVYTFKFTDQVRGATFECRLDKTPFKPCHSPKVYRQLMPGRHVFEVEAISGGVPSTIRKVKFLVPTLSSRAQ